jgi:GNAT superfamily N-acetyltransferase
METILKVQTALIKKELELNEALSGHALYHTEQYATELPSYAGFIGSALMAAMPTVDILAFNRVIGLGIQQAVTASDIKDILHFYQQAGSARFFVQLSPWAQPADVEHVLEQHGFQYYNAWVKLYRRADATVPAVHTDLRIVEVTKAQAQTYGALLVKAFDWPPALSYAFARTVGKQGYHQYFAMDGETPVAAAALFIHGDFASMAIAATLPSHRGRGAQGALLAKRIATAHALGCKYIISETAEEKPEHPVASYRNMRRFGFEVAYKRLNYIYYIP